MNRNEDSSLKIIEKVVSEKLGKSADELRNQTISEIRKEAEKKAGHPLRYKKEFPFIGRGNVLRDRLTSSDEIEKKLEELFGH